MLRTKRYNRGFSLLEVILSMSLVSITFWGSIVGLQYLWGGVRARRVYSTEVTMVQRVFNNIRSNPSQFYAQASTPDETVGGVPVTPAEFPLLESSGEYTVESLAKFQYAYSTNGRFFGSPADCPECDGRMMYLLQPYGSLMPGMLKVTVRVVKLKGRKQIKNRDFYSIVNY